MSVFNQEKELIYSFNLPSIDITSADSVPVLLLEIEKIVGQVKESMNISIGKLIVAGEVALIPSVEQRLQTSNHIPIVVGNAEYLSQTSSLEFSKKEKLETYTTALGLSTYSLHNNVDSSNAVNFLKHRPVYW